MTTTDRFGNSIPDDLPYARGAILDGTTADYRELRKARRIIRDRIDDMGSDAVHNATGLERGFPVPNHEVSGYDDETAPAMVGPAFRQAALTHLGGRDGEHDVFVTNRLTGATMSAFLAHAEPGSTVVAVAPNYSHASVVRAAQLAGVSLVETTTPRAFADELEQQSNVSLAVLSRMDVTYEHFESAAVDRIVAAAHAEGVPVYMDDAGGARVLPAVHNHPLSLETGVDLIATGLDKYGVLGPRFGLVGGTTDLVERVRTTAWKHGMESRPVFLPAVLHSLEQYDPTTVQAAVDAAKAIGVSLRESRDYVRETSVIVILTGEDILADVLDTAGIDHADAPIVPFEATAAVSMLLLRDHGIVTVHFAGVPSGTGDFLVKFIPPDTLEAIGGPQAFARAVDDAISRLSGMVADPAAVRRLLLE